jgi:hypothetical protein
VWALGPHRVFPDDFFDFELEPLGPDPAREGHHAALGPDFVAPGLGVGIGPATEAHDEVHLVGDRRIGKQSQDGAIRRLGLLLADPLVAQSLGAVEVGCHGGFPVAGGRPA